MSDTRVQVANLLCKIFLHYLVLLSEWDGMLELWMRILDVMDRLMNSGQGDTLEEAVPESVKNILLVMADGGFIGPPGKREKPSEMWEQTVNRVERFLPDLIKEIFPQVEALDPEPEPENKAATSVKEGDVFNQPEGEPRPSNEQSQVRPIEGDLD